VPEGKRHHINVSEGDFDEFGWWRYGGHRQNWNISLFLGFSQ
jgi:hypothetical protein